MEYGFHHHVAAEIHYIIEGGQQYHFLDKPSQSVYSDGYILIPCEKKRHCRQHHAAHLLAEQKSRF